MLKELLFKEKFINDLNKILEYFIGEKGLQLLLQLPYLDRFSLSCEDYSDYFTGTIKYKNNNIHIEFDEYTICIENSMVKENIPEDDFYSYNNIIIKLNENNEIINSIDTVCIEIIDYEDYENVYNEKNIAYEFYKYKDKIIDKNDIKTVNIQRNLRLLNKV